MNIHRFKVAILLVLSNFSCLLVRDAVNGGREAGSCNGDSSILEGRYSYIPIIPGACQLEKCSFLRASEYRAWL